MFILKAFRQNDKNIDLTNSPVSLQDFNSIVELLNFNSAIQGELEFELTDLDNKKNTYKIISSNTKVSIFQGEQELSINFYQLIKENAGLVLDFETLKKRLIQIYNPNSEELKQKIEVLQINPEIQSLLDAALLEEQQLKAKIEEGLSPESKEKYSRVTEINNRLLEIQAQIEFYQSEKKIREEINNNIKKLNNESQTYSQMLQSVELLIKSREDLVLKLNNFQNSSRSIDEIKSLKLQKYNYLNTKLLSSRVPSLINNESEEETPVSKGFKLGFNLIIVLLLINIGVSLLGFLYSYNISVLITGILATIVLMVLYIVSKFFTDTLSDLDTLNESEYKKEEPKAKFQEQEDPNTQLFVNAAWANALKSEVDAIDDNIQKNLNGKSYESLKGDQVKNEQSLKEENQKLEDLSKKSITSDEYYKKRRESDILKIEKENIEFGLKIEPDLLDKQKELKDSVNRSKTKLKLAAQLSESFPVFVQFMAENAEISSLSNNLLNQVVLVKAN